MAGTKARALLRILGGKVCIALLTINIAVFVILHLCVWCGIDSHTATSALSMPADFDAIAVRPWTPLTYMFTQWNLLHLLANILWMAAFGAIFFHIGLPGLTWRIYLAGGICGAAAFMAAAAHASGTEMLAGSSAAVMGLVCAAAVYRPHARISLMLFGEFPLWILASIVIALYAVISIPSATTCAAHIGGALGGGVYAYAEKVIRKRRALRANRALQHTAKADIHTELDEILAKVGRSGYGSLSRHERQRLFEISRQLK